MKSSLTDVFGPDVVDEIFGIVGSVPDITFTKEELVRAQELGQDLIFFVKENESGPLTLKAMYSKHMYSIGYSGLRLNLNWHREDRFFNEAVPVSGWALVSRSVLRGSINRNYVEETQAIVDYLVDEVYQGLKMPEAYKRVIAEFKFYKQELIELIRENTQESIEECNRRCTALKVNQLFRERPVEVFYGLTLWVKVNNRRLLRGWHTRTNTCTDDGRIVECGCYSDPHSWRVACSESKNARPRLGTRFIRRPS